MRSSPALAKMAPCQGLSCSFCKRVFTLPRKFTTVWFGYWCSHCALRLKDPVAMVQGFERSIACFVTKMSCALALFNTAPCTIPLGSAVGTSFKECTATSTVLFNMATSSVLVKIPVIPISYKGVSSLRSP